MIFFHRLKLELISIKKVIISLLVCFLVSIGAAFFVDEIFMEILLIFSAVIAMLAFIYAENDLLKKILPLIYYLCIIWIVYQKCSSFR